jgi:uncharacterized membrane protein YgaE (UPF0421/DUF939 family)
VIRRAQPAGADPRAGGGSGPLAELGQMSRASLTDRWRRVRANLVLALQAGVAAGLAWTIAHQVIGHRAPFFAPIAAVITLAVSVGQRLRRAFELVIGVALGIAVGDVIIYFIGTGGVQIAVVVSLAIMTALFVGGAAPLVSQAASSAVLVATLSPPTGGIYYGRFVDALTGGLVAVGVMALLLPLNPLVVTGRAADPLLRAMAEELHSVAAALATGDRAAVDAALIRLRAAESDLVRLREALAAAQETAALAPVRWRSRGALTQYVEAADHVARALRNSRVLLRRSAAVISDREPVPPALPRSVEQMAEALVSLRRDLGSGGRLREVRESVVAAAAGAGLAYRQGVGFSGGVVVAQLRSIAIDLLRAAGVEREAALRTIRAAAAGHPAAGPGTTEPADPGAADPADSGATGPDAAGPDDADPGDHPGDADGSGAPRG